MFYVKIRIKYQESGLTNTVIIRAKNNTQAEAVNYAESVVSSWDDISSAEVIEAGTREMKLQKFLLVIKLYFPKAPPKKMNFYLNEETEEKAALLMDDIVQDWKNWKEYEIITVIPVNTKQWN